MKREWKCYKQSQVSVKDTLLSSCFALLCYVCKEASSYKIPSTVLDWLDLSSSSCFPVKKTIKGHSYPVFRWTNGPRIIFSRKIFPSSASWPSLSTHDGAESQHLCFRGSGDRAWSTWGVDLVGTAEGLAPLIMRLDQCLWALHLAFSFRWGHLSNSFTGSCSQFCCQMEIYHKGPFSGFLATGGRTEAIRETPDLFQLSKSCAALAPVHPSILFQLYSMDIPSTRGTMQPILHFDSEKVGTVKHRHLPLVDSIWLFPARAFGRSWRESWLIQRSIHPCTWSLHSSHPQEFDDGNLWVGSWAFSQSEILSVVHQQKDYVKFKYLYIFDCRLYMYTSCTDIYM